VQIATKSGTDAGRLVTSVVVRYLDEETRFLAACRKRTCCRRTRRVSERGEFIEEEEMDARLEAMFEP
jgi:CRISPR/Cas system-associated protein Csm6